MTFKSVITLVISGFIGNYIAALFQKRNKKNAVILRKLNDETKMIIDLSKKITESSNRRRYAAQKLINSLLNSSHLSDADTSRIDILREKYREEVKNWNQLLPSYNIDLYSMKLRRLSYQFLENNCYHKDVKSISLNDKSTPSSIHGNFYESHILINEFINHDNKNYKLLTKASINLSSTFKYTREIVNCLQQESDKRWDDILNHGCSTEELTINNLEDASIYILFRSIFNFKSHTLRIKRSSN